MGALGREGKGSNFFIIYFKKYFTSGSIGTAPWEWHRGNGTVGMAPWERQQFFLLSVSKIFLHRIIEMIYFDGSIGAGEEGQQFFLLSISKKILHLVIQMIYFDGSMGTGA